MHTGSNNNQGIHWITDSRRAAIRTRDACTCVYCGRAATDLDHVTGRGNNETANLVVACRSCNAAKGHLSLSGFAVYLRARGLDVAAVMAHVALAVSTPVAVGRASRPSTVRAVRRAIAQAVAA